MVASPIRDYNENYLQYGNSSYLTSEMVASPIRDYNTTMYNIKNEEKKVRDGGKPDQGL